MISKDDDSLLLYVEEMRRLKLYEVEVMVWFWNLAAMMQRGAARAWRWLLSLCLSDAFLRGYDDDGPVDG